MADPSLIETPPLDVKTNDGGTYDPFGPTAPLTLYSTGVRNAYDLVWHSNGHLYVPVNGSGSGGSTPAGTTGAACGDGGTYEGPDVPGLSGVGTQADYLFRITPGDYNGHPNPTRCEFVMNGGNPTAGNDPAQVGEYPVGTDPDVNYHGFAFDFGDHKSPNGIIEHQSCSGDGALHGKLVVVRFGQPDDIIVLTPGGAQQDIVDSQTGSGGFTGFNNPLDLVEDPSRGFLYLSQYFVHDPVHTRCKWLIRKYRKRLPPDAPDVRASYGAIVETLDHLVGRVLEAIDRAGVARCGWRHPRVSQRSRYCYRPPRRLCRRWYRSASSRPNRRRTGRKTPPSPCPRSRTQQQPPRRR